MELGNVYLMCHRNHEADTQYKYCLTLDPSNPAVLFSCGLALKKLGEVGEAQQFFERALDLAPAFREAALQLASLKTTMQRYPDALCLTRPVVEQNVETVGKWTVDSSTMRARRTATQVH
jgi:Tfp pilus assembly protein PilF